MGTYLVHHGIKGQHWGVRRFQNEDGSLKSAGKQRQKKQSGSKRRVDMKAGFKAMGQKGYVKRQMKMHKAMRKEAKRREKKVEFKKTPSTMGEAYKRRLKRKAAGYAVGAGIMAATTAYSVAKEYGRRNNIAADALGKEQGLNTVKGGFTTGFKGVKRGMDVVKRARSVQAGDFKKHSETGRVLIEQWKDVKYRQL